MSSAIEASPLRHLTQAELAERWQVSQRTLERWRVEDTGPAWLKLNGRIRYRLKDVLDFEHLRLRGRGSPLSRI
jgi:hypothetical protein